MNFFDEYKKEIETIYKLKYKKDNLDESDKKNIDLFVNELMKSYKQSTIKIKNTTLQEIGEPEKEIDFIQFYDSCRNNNAVFSLSHGAYKGEKSQILEIWDEQITRRKEFKEKMKDELKVQNYAKVSLYNNFQKVFKENANALYGAFGEENFCFYDINSISNLTGTCYYTLLTTINQIEKILGNRILLRNRQEVFDYISYLYNKDTSPLLKLTNNIIYRSSLDKISNSDIEYVLNKFKEYMTFDDDELIDIIKDIIYDVFMSEDNDRKLIFKYNCNFIKLVEDTDIFKYMIDCDFENFLSSKYDEHKFKETSVDIKSILETIVYDDFLQSNLLDLCDNYKRSVVMLSDTDSTFCVTDQIFNSILDSVNRVCNEKNIKFESEQDLKVHSFKIIMFIGETMSDFFLKTLAGPKYQNSMDNRWKLKSEFLYHKILLLKVKKTYFGSILSQEGIRLSPMKLDNKNTELVRSKYSIFTKDFLKDIFYHIVMTEDKGLDIYKILDIVDEYRNKFNILSNDYIEFSKFGSRADFKLDKAYKNDPMSVWQYKAAVTFNALFPESKTLPGDKTMIMPIKSFKCPSDITNEEDVKNWFIDTYGVNEELKKRFIDLFNKENKLKIEEKLIDVLLKDRSINYLAFNYYSSMPECMLEIVDKESIGLDLIDNRIIRIFDALRIKTYNKSVNSKNKTYLTNMLIL